MMLKKTAMKTILMLIDFSENADHAAKTAAKIVPDLKADILLNGYSLRNDIITNTERV